MAAMCLGDISNARSASRAIGVRRVRAAAQLKKATKVLRKAVKAVVKSSKSSLKKFAKKVKKFAKKETKKAKKLIAKSKKALKSAKKKLAKAKASGNKKAIRKAQKKLKAIKKKVRLCEPCSLGVSRGSGLGLGGWPHACGALGVGPVLRQVPPPRPTPQLLLLLSLWRSKLGTVSSRLAEYEASTPNHRCQRQRS